jgi:hypothetical protein
MKCPICNIAVPNTLITGYAFSCEGHCNCIINNKDEIALYTIYFEVNGEKYCFSSLLNPPLTKLTLVDEFFTSIVPLMYGIEGTKECIVIKIFVPFEEASKEFVERILKLRAFI